MKTNAASFFSILFFSLMTFCPLVCRAASPPDALAAAIDVYDHAQTIQATITARTETSQGTNRTKITAQIINRPGGQTDRERIEMVTDDPTFPGGVTHGKTRVFVYDGKTLYTLYPAQKNYTAEVGADRFSEIFRPALLKYLAHGGKVTAARSARLNGEPVTLIEGQGSGLTLRGIVSGRSHALQSLYLTNDHPHTILTFTVTSLRLNALLPPGLSWKPPADYAPLTETQGKPNAELPDFSQVSPKPAGSVPAATSAEARKWLQKMVDAQQRLRSYAASGEKVEEIVGETGSKSRVTAEIKYALPNQISVVTTVPLKRGAEHTIAVCDGQWLSARVPSETGRYLHIPAPKGRQAYDQACAVFVTEDNFFSPGLGLEMMMRGDSPLRFLTEASGSFSMGPDGVVDKIPVKTVSVTLAMTASGEPFQSATYLIGRDDFLLRRLVWKEKMTGDRTHIVTQTFTRLRVNPELPASAFAFTPPVQAKAVTSLP